jgi:hypothetical protein
MHFVELCSQAVCLMAAQCIWQSPHTPDIDPCQLQRRGQGCEWVLVHDLCVFLTLRMASSCGSWLNSALAVSDCAGLALQVECYTDRPNVICRPNATLDRPNATLTVSDSIGLAACGVHLCCVPVLHTVAGHWCCMALSARWVDGMIQQQQQQQVVL